ncbi:hypothetical protein [Marinobacter sp. F3R11]|uniref:hypothetical protein n=1 Tax=Marinobacter sp. F3R11 TaxID=2267231 RepID=UPI0011E5DFE3|nr:hypothetical protein [Marinobacter sp. F3R11]
MEKLERISSADGRQIFEVVQDNDGSYLLHKFVRKYDSEEDKSYEIREYPDPTGRFGDFDSAVKEAKNLLEIEY